VNFAVDASEFIARALALLSGVDRAAVEAIRAATLDVFHRCYTESPTVPMRTGALRGSGGAYVQGVLVQRGDGPDTYAPPPRISVPSWICDRYHEPSTLRMRPSCTRAST
jgi:hypothetical protein